MERRVFMKRAAVGIAAVVVPGATAWAEKKTPVKLDPSTQTLLIGSKKVKVTEEQIKAYESLPQSVKEQLGTPKGNKLPTADQIKGYTAPAQGLATSSTGCRTYNTCMCPW